MARMIQESQCEQQDLTDMESDKDRELNNTLTELLLAGGLSLVCQVEEYAQNHLMLLSVTCQKYSILEVISFLSLTAEVKCVDANCP